MPNADVVGGLFDLATGAMSLFIAVGCVILAKVILKEREPPLLWMQRIALYIVAAAAFANGFTFWPDYLLLGGHRPTGIVFVGSVAALIAVMILRGNMVNGARMRPRSSGASRQESPF